MKKLLLNIACLCFYNTLAMEQPNQQQLDKRLIDAVRSAMWGRGTQEIQRAIAAGANPNVQHGSYSSLHKIIMDRNDNSNFKIALLEALLEVGADINIVDCRGRSPLFYAADQDKIEAMGYLISQGASAKNISLVDIINNPSALDDEKMQTTLKTLLDAGARSNEQVISAAAEKDFVFSKHLLEIYLQLQKDIAAAQIAFRADSKENVTSHSDIFPKEILQILYTCLLGVTQKAEESDRS
jgi:ankyrin repeat protein